VVLAAIMLSTAGNEVDISAVNGARIRMKSFAYLAVLILIGLQAQAIPHLQQDLSSF
jgi:hypothetical protein